METVKHQRSQVGVQISLTGKNKFGKNITYRQKTLYQYFILTKIFAVNFKCLLPVTVCLKVFTKLCLDAFDAFHHSSSILTDLLDKLVCPVCPCSNVKTKTTRNG